MRVRGVKELGIAERERFVEKKTKAMAWFESSENCRPCSPGRRGSGRTREWLVNWRRNSGRGRGRSWRRRRERESEERERTVVEEEEEGRGRAKKGRGRSWRRRED